MAPAPSTMLRMVPLPRFAVEEKAAGAAHPFPCSAAEWGRGTARRAVEGVET